MALTKKQWIFSELPVNNSTEEVQKRFNVHPVIAELLVKRGFNEPSEIEQFLKPSVKNMHDPFEMKDMQQATDRLCSAIDSKEKILVYGDYDVDGTTAVAMMYSFLKRLTPNVDFYVPDRYTEGYGVSRQGIDYASNNGVSLIITLDCGIRAIEMTNLAKNRGIDIIICDHHNPGDILPNALAVLDPKQEDCTYPFKELSGCGVGFKLIEAVCQVKELNKKEFLFCYLDLLAISIAADIVPIVGENRILAHFGLKKIVMSPMPGIKALLEVSGLEQIERLPISEVVFKIGPRINAAGRIETGSRAVELLIADDVSIAKNIALEVDSYNEDRKGIDRQTTEEALKMIEDDKSSKDRRTTVVYQDYWHKGVVGIVASRLIEHHYKPTIVLTFSEGKITGSARSVDGFDLYSALEQCDSLLSNWGGHKYAAGMSLKPENLPAFIDRFEAVVSERITDEQLVPKVYVDSLLPLDVISQSFFNQLTLFEPFGPGNMTPVFASENVKDSGGSRAVGADMSHLKVSVCDDTNVMPVNGIGFGLGDRAEEIKSAPFSISYTLNENVFRGNTSIQMMVKDIKQN